MRSMCIVVGVDCYNYRSHACEQEVRFCMLVNTSKQIGWPRIPTLTEIDVLPYMCSQVEVVAQALHNPVVLNCAKTLEVALAAIRNLCVDDGATSLFTSLGTHKVVINHAPPRHDDCKLNHMRLAEVERVCVDAKK